MGILPKIYRDWNPSSIFDYDEGESEHRERREKVERKREERNKREGEERVER